MISIPNSNADFFATCFILKSLYYKSTFEQNNRSSTCFTFTCNVSLKGFSPTSETLEVAMDAIEK
jgi:hypothetical protein